MIHEKLMPPQEWREVAKCLRDEDPNNSVTDEALDAGAAAAERFGGEPYLKWCAVHHCRMVTCVKLQEQMSDKCEELPLFAPPECETEVKS